MKKRQARMSVPSMTKTELEKLAHFRYRLRRFLCVSEEVTRTEGITTLAHATRLFYAGAKDFLWPRFTPHPVT